VYYKKTFFVSFQLYKQQQNKILILLSLEHKSWLPICN